MLRFQTSSTGLIFAAENSDFDHDSRALRRAVGESLVRIRRGVYIDAQQWQSSSPGDRQRLRVIGAAHSMAPGTTFSHFAAAALHGLPMVDQWPTRIDVLISDDSRTSTSRGVSRHQRRSADIDIDDRSGLRATTPARTVVDIAMSAPFHTAVIMIDRAIWTSDPMTSIDEIRRILESLGAVRGSFKALKAIDFSTELSDSTLESYSRVQMLQLGYPAPVLQVEFRLASGRRVRVDFWWPTYRVIGEADGDIKYLDERYRNGRTADQVVLDEKRREDELRLLSTGFARWGMREARQPLALAAKLDLAGLPRS